MNVEEALQSVTAKAAMLEQLVRMLVVVRLRELPNPTKSAEDLAKHMISLMEENMREGPNAPSTILMTENLRMFFDSAIHELGAKPQGGS